MAVQLTIDLLPTQRSEFRKRLRWLEDRIPTKEYHVLRSFAAGGDDYWSSDDNHLMAEVSVWSDDADRVATEYWFKFP